MKEYKFITDDDTLNFCHRVTENLSHGWKLYGEPQYLYDSKKIKMRAAQSVIKNSSKIYSKKLNLSVI